MGTLLKQKQNMAKALEIRMEQESQQKFNVILAGMTINTRGGCVGGTCEGNFLFTENLTYKVDSFNTFDDAAVMFEQMKGQYIDQ